MKKENNQFYIINYWGNFWNGKGFIMDKKNAKEYKTFGKAILALPLARATEGDRVMKQHMKVKRFEKETSSCNHSGWNNI